MSKTMSSSSLQGRTAIVTGGARGLGTAIAQALAARGANIAILDLLPIGEQTAAAIADTYGVRTTFSSVDVTEEESIVAAFESIEGVLGAADILVNSAGISSGIPGMDITAASWNKLFAVNVTGTLSCSQEFARRFISARGDSGRQASIVNLTSMSALAVNIPQTQSAYNSSKAAVAMMTKSLAIEWLPLGIRVNAIAPGYFASDMTLDFIKRNPEIAQQWIDKIPAGRMGEPHELGPLVSYLVSDDAAYVVGQNFVIDGGYTLV